jgi:hypothetical protein
MRQQGSIYVANGNRAGPDVPAAARAGAGSTPSAMIT